jgi:endonuclease G
MKKLAFLPILILLFSFKGDGLKLINHKAFQAHYNSSYSQSELVVYSVTKKRLQGKVSRSIAKFLKDPLEKTSLHTDDYTGSGFDRGHLAPAADMVWHETAMRECFYTTNITPQYPGFNRGEWKELEFRVRSEAIERDSLVVYVGVLFKNKEKVKNLYIPSGFYKIIYDPSKKESIAFLFPHLKQIKKYDSYVSDVKTIEKMVGREIIKEEKEYNNSKDF